MTTIVNLSRGTVLATSAEIARGPWRQFLGLMGRPELPPGSGLVLPRTRGVHTHFMRFPIDVLFYDKNLVVLDAVHNLRPWRFSPYHFQAAGAIELPAGAAKCSTRRGDVLAFRQAPMTGLMPVGPNDHQSSSEEA